MHIHAQLHRYAGERGTLQRGSAPSRLLRIAQPQANQPTRGSSSAVGRPAMAVSTTTSLLELYWLRSSCRSHRTLTHCLSLRGG